MLEVMVFDPNLKLQTSNVVFFSPKYIRFPIFVITPLTMKCIIVDDNTMARMALKQLVAQVPSLDLVAECEDAEDALSSLNSTQVDLVLLDIEMPGMSGLELIKKLGNTKPLIIFTTSKKDYAVEAFELS